MARAVTPGIKVYHMPFAIVYNQAILPTALAAVPLMRHIMVRERVQVVHGHSAFSTLANEALGVAAYHDLVLNLRPLPHARTAPTAM